MKGSKEETQVLGTCVGVRFCRIASAPLTSRLKLARSMTSKWWWGSPGSCQQGKFTHSSRSQCVPYPKRGDELIDHFGTQHLSSHPFMFGQIHQCSKGTLVDGLTTNQQVSCTFFRVNRFYPVAILQQRNKVWHQLKGMQVIVVL